MSITPVGPIEANTCARPAAARREISTPARLISAARSARPCRARMNRLAPKVLVRMIWLPASTYARATSSTLLGLLQVPAVGAGPDRQAPLLQLRPPGPVGHDRAGGQESFQSVVHALLRGDLAGEPIVYSALLTSGSSGFLARPAVGRTKRSSVTIMSKTFSTHSGGRRQVSMAIATNLGFPRIGVRRELKRAVEGYWRATSSRKNCRRPPGRLRRRHWQLQRDAGIEHIPSGDFSLYDHVLDTAAMVGAIPGGFAAAARPSTWPPISPWPAARSEVAPLEMTKWFDTNYHYLVPEFESRPAFRLASTAPGGRLLRGPGAGHPHAAGAAGAGLASCCWARASRPGVRPLGLLDRLLPVYEEVHPPPGQGGAEWIQIDEPVLALDLPAEAQAAVESAYAQLAEVSAKIKICLATYFGALRDNLALALRLPVAAVHLDLVRAPEQLDAGPGTGLRRRECCRWA